MSLRTLPRLLRTVGYLRASQVAWRVHYLAERRWPLRWRGGPPTRPAVRLAAGLREPPVFHRDSTSGERLVEELRHGRLTQLNGTFELGRERPDWRLGPVACDRLGAITLHYHGWLEALAEVSAGTGPLAEEALGLLVHYLSDWIARCAVSARGARELAWNSFALATRLGNWVRIWLFLAARRPAAWTALEPRFLDSLWRQADWLARHLEWDLRGNHVLRDLVGLAWAGRFFREGAARGWAARAAALVPGQLAEQVLPDGAHFERSPHYHVQAMADVFALALLLEPSDLVEELRSAWLRMAVYLAWLRHPDGLIAHFGDGGLASAAEPACMLAAGQRLGFDLDTALPAGGKLFPDAGVVVWHGNPWTVFFDVGPVAADHVPGHGHADTLSFECSFRGRRLVVDPGCFAYDRDARRVYDRSTAAHNTVSIDDLDSSEMWDIFRVGRRAHPSEVFARFTSDGFEAGATHDGYRQIAGLPAHRRRIQCEPSGLLVVTDVLQGTGRHRARGGLLLEPAWSAEPAEGGFRLTGDGRRLFVRVTTRGPRPELTIERAPYHPGPGLEREGRRLVWTVECDFPIEVRTEIGEP